MRATFVGQKKSDKKADKKVDKKLNKKKIEQKVGQEIGQKRGNTVPKCGIKPIRYVDASLSSSARPSDAPSQKTRRQNFCCV